MKTFAVSGRCIAVPPPAEWREQLTQMLGAKPRRIGTWAELGLYGALRCIADAGEVSLPQTAQIWLGSRRGTYAATETVLQQLREDLPMPLAFLQTQPTQPLALLAAHLKWSGSACFVAWTDPIALLRLAVAQAGDGGALLGWVDEMENGASNWLRLHPCATTDQDFCAASAETLFSPHTSHLRVAGTCLEVRQGASG